MTTMQMTTLHRSAYLAPEGFEKELIEELGSRVDRIHGRLVIAKASATPPAPPAWAANSWLHVEEFKIDSISDAARKLRSRGRDWALYSLDHHRRATLIAEKLPRHKNPQLEFLDELPPPSLGSWTLLDPNTILASPQCSSRFPNGEMAFFEDNENPPSRAYLKLWELFTVHAARPRAGSNVLDMGSCPGGWTWVLSELGCNVLSIDKAPLAAKIAARPNVRYIKHNAFTLKPNDVEPFEWFFSDIICEPRKLYELVLKWRDVWPQANFVCTIKFKGPTDHTATRDFAAIPGSRVLHLNHNKHELTWLCGPDACTERN
jgi:23S rRNA (cytidine2498-2'-O)-methyltransferase